MNLLYRLGGLSGTEPLIDLEALWSEETESYRPTARTVETDVEWTLILRRLEMLTLHRRQERVQTEFRCVAKFGSLEQQSAYADGELSRKTVRMLVEAEAFASLEPFEQHCSWEERIVAEPPLEHDTVILDEPPNTLAHIRKAAPYTARVSAVQHVIRDRKSRSVLRQNCARVQLYWHGFSLEKEFAL